MSGHEVGQLWREKDATEREKARLVEENQRLQEELKKTKSASKSSSTPLVNLPALGGQGEVERLRAGIEALFIAEEKQKLAAELEQLKLRAEIRQFKDKQKQQELEAEKFRLEQEKTQTEKPQRVRKPKKAVRKKKELAAAPSVSEQEETNEQLEVKGTTLGQDKKPLSEKKSKAKEDASAIALCHREQEQEVAEQLEVEKSRLEEEKRHLEVLRRQREQQETLCKEQEAVEALGHLEEEKEAARQLAKKNHLEEEKCRAEEVRHQREKETALCKEKEAAEASQHAAYELERQRKESEAKAREAKENEKVSEFLKYVVEGEQDKAEALLKTRPGLTLRKGAVTDLSKREFKNITGFQYALWALDWHMWKMLLKYMSKEAAAEQYQALEEKGTAYGKHVSWQGLIDAYTAYLQSYGSDYWIKQVGGAQLLLPVHVANEYCHRSRAFYPLPDFSMSTEGLTRSRVSGYVDWYDDRCGKEWAHYRSISSHARHTSWPLQPPRPEADWRAVASLLEVRQRQLADLGKALITELMSSL